MNAKKNFHKQKQTMMNDNQQQEIRSVSAGVVDRILAKEQAFIELDSLSGEAIVEQVCTSYKWRISTDIIYLDVCENSIVESTR